jgi:hypothetical protein
LLVDRDEYVADFAGDALKTVLGILSRFHPGRLIEFVVDRDAEIYSMSVKFTIDDRPGVVYSYRRTVLDTTYEPEFGTESAVDVLFGSIMERLARASNKVDGVVDLNG